MSDTCNHMDCNPLGSFLHGISQARILEWVAISFSRESSQPRDRTWVSCIADRCFTVWATRETYLPEFAQTQVHWINDAIQSSRPVTPFSSRLESFPASGSFLMSQFFASGGQSIGASVSVLPTNIQGWSPLGLTGLLSLLSKGLSRVFSSTTVEKHRFFGVRPSLWCNCHICTWLLEKTQLWLDGPLLVKWCLCFPIHCLGLS